MDGIGEYSHGLAGLRMDATMRNPITVVRHFIECEWKPRHLQCLGGKRVTQLTYSTSLLLLTIIHKLILKSSKTIFK